MLRKPRGQPFALLAVVARDAPSLHAQQAWLTSLRRWLLQSTGPIVSHVHATCAAVQREGARSIAVLGRTLMNSSISFCMYRVMGSQMAAIFKSSPS